MGKEDIVMKKLFLSIIAAVGIAVILPVSAFADTSTSIIAGNIYKSAVQIPANLDPGVNVQVVCNGNTLNTTSTSAGGYAVTFVNGACPAGDTAVVTASKNGASGSSSGTVNNVTDTNINVAIVSVSIVPELGALTGTGAAILGGAAFMVVRRRQLSGHEA